VSGSSTATLSTLDDDPLLPDEVLVELLLLLLPQAATPNASAASTPATASARREIGECIT
jgi:hypothetical protein